MARRPSRLMRWAYDAPGGAVVEPPTGRAKRGWETGKRPPAQWMNALLQNAAAWADFLRSGSLSKWERVSFGSTELNPLYIVAGADNVTEDGAGSTPNRRLVIAGDDGSGPCVLVSRRGNDWTLIRNFPGGVYGSSPTSVTYLGGRWWITLDAGPYVRTNTGFLLSTLGDPQPGSNLDGSGTWTSQTLPGSVSGLVGFAFDGDKCFVAASRTDLFVSVDNGSTWSGVTPATTGGADRRTDVCFDGRAFVAIDSDGAVHKSAPGTSALSAWPHVATITVGSVPTPNWRLAVDDAGTVVAWPKSASQCPFYASTTHGGTWTEIAPAGPYPKNIHSLVFADGVWVAATQNAPFLWQSNDLQSWVPLRLPYLESESYGTTRLSSGRARRTSLRGRGARIRRPRCSRMRGGFRVGNSHQPRRATGRCSSGTTARSSGSRRRHRLDQQSRGPRRSRPPKPARPTTPSRPSSRSRRRRTRATSSASRSSQRRGIGRRRGA